MSDRFDELAREWLDRNHLTTAAAIPSLAIFLRRVAEEAQRQADEQPGDATKVDELESAIGLWQDKTLRAEDRITVLESDLAAARDQVRRLREQRDGMLREVVRCLDQWLAKGMKPVWTPYMPPSACTELLSAAGFFGATRLEDARAALAETTSQKERRDE